MQIPARGDLFKDELEKLFTAADSDEEEFYEKQQVVDQHIRDIYMEEADKNPRNAKQVDYLIDQITEAFTWYNARYRERKDGQNTNETLLSVDSKEYINKHVKERSSTFNHNQLIGHDKEKNHVQEDIENFKNQVDFIEVREKPKELHEHDPLKFSIGDIFDLSEKTQVFPGEKDGKGKYEAR